MIIKKMVLKDFRQYKGRQEIKFSTDKEKNVTVILGLNTSGKTTLIEAFKWCLYGNDNTTYLIRELINAEAEHELEISENGQIYVEIVLVHKETEYILKRTQNYFKATKSKSTLKDSRISLAYKESTGEMIHIRTEEIADSINTILPMELSDYFFFDGERIGDIGNRSDIKNAVQGLMGLDVITEAKKRLDPKRKNSVINRLESKLDIGSGENAEKLTQDLEKHQDKLEEYNQNLKDIDNEKKYYETNLRQVSEKIAANQSVRDKQNERIKIEKELEKEKMKLEKLMIDIKKDFANKSFDFFSIPLIKRATNTLNNTKEEVEGIAGMTAKAIDQILKREVCICGNNLKENQYAIKKILQEKDLLPPNHIGTVVNQTKKSYEYFEDRGHRFKSDIIMDFERYENTREEIADKEKLLETISEALKDNIDVSEWEIKREEYKRKLRELENKRDIIIKNIGSYEKSIESLKNSIKSLSFASDKNIGIYECIDYSKALYELFKENYKSREEKVKESLEKNVNEIFENIYHGKRYVKIDDDYNVSLDTKVSGEMIETDMSKGLEAVKNFSFVAGLVKIAKEKVKDTEDIETEEPYPLVMDAPFSNVDEIHIANISKALPKVSEQVIWILMEKDWNYAKESLKDKIGYIYDIKKINNSETYSKVEGRELYV